MYNLWLKIIELFQAEIKLLTNEKSRLKELVVTDPGEWERAFQARQNDIELGKTEISNLKSVLIPKWVLPTITQDNFLIICTWFQFVCN